MHMRPFGRLLQFRWILVVFFAVCGVPESFSVELPPTENTTLGSFTWGDIGSLVRREENLDDGTVFYTLLIADMRYDKGMMTRCAEDQSEFSITLRTGPIANNELEMEEVTIRLGSEPSFSQAFPNSTIHMNDMTGGADVASFINKVLLADSLVAITNDGMIDLPFRPQAAVIQIFRQRCGLILNSLLSIPRSKTRPSA